MMGEFIGMGVLSSDEICITLARVPGDCVNMRLEWFLEKIMVSSMLSRNTMPQQMTERIKSLRKVRELKSEDVEVDVLLKTGKSTTLSIFCERAQKSLIWQSGNMLPW